MMYQQDWIMRQIEMMVQTIAKIIFKKDTVSYELTDEASHLDTDLLYNELQELVAALKLNEAENLLYERLRTDDYNYLSLAVDFYNRLNELSDKQLEDNDFSRAEIKSGLENIAGMFGIIL